MQGAAQQGSLPLVAAPAARRWPVLPWEPSSSLHLFTWLPHFMGVYVII